MFYRSDKISNKSDQKFENKNKAKTNKIRTGAVDIKSTQRTS